MRRTMATTVGVRELRQNLSRYLDRVKAGEALVVTERGREIARLVPSSAGPYSELAARFGAWARRLDAAALVPLDQATLDAAETVSPSTVGTLDAIHLVTALRLADEGLLEAVLTYDARLAAAAASHGLGVLAPA